MSGLPRIVAIVGPTGAGKSALAMGLAESLGFGIACCDSAQVYRGLDIGTAKPTEVDRREIPHRLLDLVEPDEDFTAAAYG
ncbi:MAG: isopentenyl transferase family protein, partial [Nannocystaceae bacterium]